MPKEAVVQPRFTVAILVLQAEGLVCAIRYSSFLFQTTPAGVVAEPQEVAAANEFSFLFEATWNFLTAFQTTSKRYRDRLK